MPDSAGIAAASMSAQLERVSANLANLAGVLKKHAAMRFRAPRWNAWSARCASPIPAWWKN